MRTMWTVSIALLWPALALAQGGMLDQGRQLLEKTQPAAPGATARGAKLGVDDIAAGLKDALKIGSERVVGALGKVDGFNNGADVHIPLPDTLRSVQRALQRVGMSSLADDLELRLNRAAEAAAPLAKTIFLTAISDMTVEDARGIFNGPKDGATQYFRRKTSGALGDAMRPIVDKQLANVGALQSYDRMLGQYKQMPMVPDVKADLTGHVLEKTLAGLFLYLGREEAAIRDNPAARSTELLRKVFGT
jgi:Protein of unknown function (DUF4197)